MQMLDDATIDRRLAELPEWSRVGDEITRTVTASDFMTGIAIVGDVAEAAEQANHHPDIDIRYSTLTFRLTTHDAGGLTERDFDLARRTDQIIERRS